MINDTLTRRRFLAAGGATTLGLGAITALGTSVSLAAPGVPGDGDVLVLLDLSGAADGLSLTPPLQDSAYYDVRPTIAVRPPNQAGGSLPLSGNGRVSFSSGFDGAFGLHPAAKPIYDALWSTGKLAVVPGAGFKGSTLSHFTSANYHRKGSLSLHTKGTWLGRMVSAQGVDAAIPATGLTDVPGNFSAIGSIQNFEPERRSKIGDQMYTTVAKFYAQGDDLINATGRRAAALGREVGALVPGAASGYPDTPMGGKFSELAQLLKRRPAFGIRAASFEIGGWDHHDNLGASGDSKGKFHMMVANLAEAMAAFAKDTNGLEGITLVVTTEFGRTVNENGAKGTDHGEGLSMLIAGGGIRGGVYGDDYVDSLVMPGGASRASLPIGTDYRKPLAELIRKRVKLDNIPTVFPGFTPSGADLNIAG